MKRAGKRFDAENGVVTEGLIFLGELDPERIGEALADATHYEPTPIGEFEALLSAAHIDARERTFVDIGAGLGRVLMLASLHPFRQIIGVEVSPSLCETARDNLVRWRRAREHLACSDIRIVNASADRFRIPRGQLVFYAFNPFRAPAMERFAASIKVSCEPGTVLLYHTPEERSIFDADAAFACVASSAAGVVYRLR